MDFWKMESFTNGATFGYKVTRLVFVIQSRVRFKKALFVTVHDSVKNNEFNYLNICMLTFLKNHFTPFSKESESHAGILTQEDPVGVAPRPSFQDFYSHGCCGFPIFFAKKLPFLFETAQKFTLFDHFLGNRLTNRPENLIVPPTDHKLSYGTWFFLLGSAIFEKSRFQCVFSNSFL